MTNNKFRWHVVTVAVAAAVSVAWFGYWMWNAKAFPHVGSRYEVYADVPSAVALAPRASVRIAGLPIGQVKDIQRDGANARLKLQIDDDAHKSLPIDTHVSVRLRTLVGENYVELYPGHSRTTVPDGGTLPLSQANEYVDVDQILSVLRGSTRERAKRFFQGLGDGVEGRGQELNRFLEGAAGTLTTGSAVNRILAAQRRQVAGLVENFGDVTRAIGERGGALQQMARGMRVSFQSIARRDAALRTTLQEMPSTLTQVRTTTDTVRSVTGQIAPVLANLGVAVHELKPSVQALRPASQEGREVVDELGRASGPLTDTLTRLNTLAGPASTALPQLRKMMCQLNPIARYVAPYGHDIGAFFGSFGSAGNYYDANGHALRLGLVGTYTAVPTWDRATAGAAEKMLQYGAMKKIAFHGYNPLPGPGGADDLTTGKGIIGPADWKKPYPRVTADC